MTAGGQRGCPRREEREEREGDCWRAEGMPEEGGEGGGETSTKG